MRRVLEAAGFHLIDEDEYNWAFAEGGADAPIIIPHTVRLLPVAIMNWLFRHSNRQIGNGILREAMNVTAQELAAAAADDDDDSPMTS